MADTSHNTSQPAGATGQLKLKVRYGRLSLAVLGLLALLSGVVTGILAPFTALSVGWFFALTVTGVLCFAGLRVLAVRDRNRKLLLRMEQVRAQALATEPQAEPQRPAAPAKSESKDQVFDARPGSNLRAPAFTAEELRAEALRVAHGRGGVRQPATWEPTEIPKPVYVQARASIQQQIIAQVRPEPLPVAEPLRPSRQISLKAEERAKRLAAEVTADQRAAVADVSAVREQKQASASAQPAPAASSVPAAPAATPTGTNTPQPPNEPTPGSTPGPARINLDAVMQRRRA